jgi:hypothetical protein
MANWKKVVVSGSNSTLKSIGVGTAQPTGVSGEISASGKIFATTAVSTGLGSYNVVIKGADGEFLQTGSDAISPSLASLTLGVGLTGTSYNGSGPITTTVDSSSLSGNGLSPGAAGSNNINVGQGSNITVTADAVHVDSGSLADTARGLSAALATDKISVNAGAGVGFSGAGALTASFVAGADLIAGDAISLTTDPYNGLAESTISVNASALAGVGLADDGSNNLTLKNSGNFTAGDLLKWNDTSGQLEDSGIVESTGLLTLGGGSDTVLIPGNLVVQGTASFSHADNLEITDPFILLNSSSINNSAAGIIGAVSETIGTGWVYGGSSSPRFGMVTGSVLIEGGTAGGRVGDASLLVNATTLNAADGDTNMEATGNFLVASDEIYVYF